MARTVAHTSNAHDMLLHEMLPLQKMAPTQHLSSDLRADLDHLKSDVGHLHAPVRASDSGGATSQGVDQDAHVARLFSTNKNGVVYLQCAMLSAEAVAQLKTPGERFSVAGKIELKTWVMDHGPCNMLEFTVPANKLTQYKRWSASMEMLDFLPEPAHFSAAPFCTLLSLDQAQARLMTDATPMWPAVN